MKSTSYVNKCAILADLDLNYKWDWRFDDLRKYSDLGLPLAYAIHNGIVQSTEMAQRFVEETFDMLLGTLEIKDSGFENLEEVLKQAENGS